ncbi:MAG: sugar phosphate isomerase/epimerase [Acidobacteriaceae bacterium]|nr:sugar phosphate isomerase/epimerase [Acidobacteriaceae bacterium]
MAGMVSPSYDGINNGSSSQLTGAKPVANPTRLGRIGVGSWTFPWAIGTVREHPPQRPLTAAMLVRKARELGVRTVQLGDNLPVDQLSAEELHELKGTAAECGIQLEIGTRGVKPSHLFRYLEIARLLGARLVRTMAGWPGAAPPLAEVENDLREALPKFAQAGVSVGMENYETYSTAELAALIRRVDQPNLGVCLDVSNSLGALESADTILDALLPLTINVHVKDIAVERLPYMMGFAFYGRPAGRGRVPFETIFSRLAGAGRKANAIVELWTPFNGSLEQTLALEESWAKESIAYLAKLPWLER